MSMKDTHAASNSLPVSNFFLPVISVALCLAFSPPPFILSAVFWMPNDGWSHFDCPFQHEFVFTSVLVKSLNSAMPLFWQCLIPKANSSENIHFLCGYFSEAQPYRGAAFVFKSPYNIDWMYCNPTSCFYFNPFPWCSLILIRRLSQAASSAHILPRHPGFLRTILETVFLILPLHTTAVELK